ncbi:L-threonylcarbamoyladenylate synthase [Candidatus Phytoplasma melaleucae]|uniref:L-threonylcarbamoyladenylate synthase n=1 Tax=Candidatus Phytoplasma melaleucae TaxID=2982630 RepID=A0ABT9DD53_9MOLU|nr:Sua5/YciO/YrdC/YwlC family protein ['Melaleuca sp.' phytoplasma]MDO8168002.1 Sua5/YciO/YrdC/YwlC family protein ['Melaleuca sp.' phytoplasma]
MMKKNIQVKKIALFFWPGALTLIVQTHPSYCQLTKEKKIGIRIPNHLLTLKLLQKKGPLKTTSVNESGFPPLQNLKVLINKYQNQVDYIYLDNQNLSQTPSTVIDTTTTPFWRVLRKGAITLSMIRKILIK